MTEVTHCYTYGIVLSEQIELRVMLVHEKVSKVSGNLSMGPYALKLRETPEKDNRMPLSTLRE